MEAVFWWLIKNPTILSANVLLILLLLLFALGCGMFGYWLGHLRGEREGFDTGRNYQRLKDRADSLRDDPDVLPDWVYLN